MNYKLPIDMCYFYNTHAGGKDEVAYNLFRGFEKLGVSEQIVCFCYKKLFPIIKKVNPSGKICVVPKIRNKIERVRHC